MELSPRWGQDISSLKHQAKFVADDHLKTYFLWKIKKKLKMLSAAIVIRTLTLVLLITDILCFCKQCSPDQLACEEANWSGSALFVIESVNLYQQTWIK